MRGAAPREDSLAPSHLSCPATWGFLLPTLAKLACEPNFLSQPVALQVTPARCRDHISPLAGVLRANFFPEVGNVTNAVTNAVNLPIETPKQLFFRVSQACNLLSNENA